MSDLTFRPRTATELVDAAFRLYRQHFVELLTLSTIAYIPVIIFLVGYVFVLGTIGGSSVSVAGPGAMIAGVAMTLGMIGMFFSYPVLRAALNVKVSEAYHGRAIDAGGAIRVAMSRYGTVLGAWYGKWIIVIVAGVVGIFLLAAPAFYFVARFFAIPSTVVIEQTDVGGAFSRSSQLSSGYKWKILGTLALGWMLLFAMSVTVTIIVVVIMGIMMVSGGSPDQMVDPQSAMLLQLPSIAAYIVGLPLTVIIETLLYYDMRIRQEGYDLEVMSAQLVPTGAGAATG